MKRYWISAIVYSLLVCLMLIPVSASDLSDEDMLLLLNPSQTLYIGDTYTLDSSFIWTSSNTDALVVEDGYRVHCIGTGVSYISNESGIVELFEGREISDIEGDWEYDIESDESGSSYIVLEKYIGEDEDVVVDSSYIVEGSVYRDVRLASSSMESSPFTETETPIQTLRICHGTTATLSMVGMFAFDEDIAYVNLSGLDTSGVTDMTCMYYHCPNLDTVIMRDLDTSGITRMSHMFNGCTSLSTVDIGEWNTTNLTRMNHMFSQCTSLTTVDLSELDTSNVTDMSHMFSACTGLTTVVLDSFNTSNVTNMSYMFASCTKLTRVFMTNFTLRDSTDLTFMFAGDVHLKKVYWANIAMNNSDVRNMFMDCFRLDTVGLPSWAFKNYVVTSFPYP